jgi:hypothetical protein
MKPNSIDPILNSLLSDQPEKLEKPSALAGLLGIKSDTILDWQRRYPEHLPALKLPASIRIRRCDLVAFLRKIQNGEVK